MPSEKDYNLTRNQLRAITSHYKRVLNHSDAAFEERWWRDIPDENKEIMVSTVIEICKEIISLKTNFQDGKRRLAIETSARDKLSDLRKKLNSSSDGKNIVSEEQLKELYEYCSKKVRQMRTKTWFYIEKQLHDVEDWCSFNESRANVITKRFNVLNDMGPYPHEVFKSLREWAVFAFGMEIINRGEDDDEKGYIGMVILMLVADSEWELRCIASLYEFARILTPDGLTKVDHSYSKFEVELAKQEKLKGVGTTNQTNRGSSLFHRSTRAVFKRVSTGQYLQNEVPVMKVR